MNAWLAQETGGPPHVTPIADLREHVLDELCWCRPFIEDGIVVHNSMDRREEYERGRKAS